MHDGGTVEAVEVGGLLDPEDFDVSVGDSMIVPEELDTYTPMCETRWVVHRGGKALYVYQPTQEKAIEVYELGGIVFLLNRPEELPALDTGPWDTVFGDLRPSGRPPQKR